MQIINYPETWIIVSLDDPIFYLKYRYEMYVINEIPISQRVLNYILYPRNYVFDNYHTTDWEGRVNMF